MKNLLVMIFMIFMISSVYATINAPMSNQFDNKGVLSRADRVEINVLMGEAASAGALLKWDTAINDDGARVVEVDATTDFPACLLEKAAASGVLTKCLIYGKSDALHSAEGDNAAADGGVYPSSDELGGKVTGITTIDTSQFHYPAGVFLDASTATESVEVFIRIQ